MFVLSQNDILPKLLDQVDVERYSLLLRMTKLFSFPSFIRTPSKKILKMVLKHFPLFFWIVRQKRWDEQTALNSIKKSSAQNLGFPPISALGMKGTVDPEELFRTILSFEKSDFVPTCVRTGEWVLLWNFRCCPRHVRFWQKTSSRFFFRFLNIG